LLKIEKKGNSKQKNSEEKKQKIQTCFLGFVGCTFEYSDSIGIAENGR